jgi:hypothetical protein
VIGDRCTADTGTALLETALIGPLVAIVLLVVFEGGLAWRDHAAATDAVATGARAAALHPSSRVDGGPAGLATVVASVRDALASVPGSSLERLVVFVPDAGAPSALPGVPAGCRGGVPAPGDRCVVVDPASWAAWSTLPECEGGASACPWRQLWQQPGAAGRVGVYLRMRRHWSLVGLGPAGTTEVAALAPLEAGRRGSD